MTSPAWEMGGQYSYIRIVYYYLFSWSVNTKIWILSPQLIKQAGYATASEGCITPKKAYEILGFWKSHRDFLGFSKIFRDFQSQKSLGNKCQRFHKTLLLYFCLAFVCIAQSTIELQPSYCTVMLFFYFTFEKSLQNIKDSN